MLGWQLTFISSTIEYSKRILTAIVFEGLTAKSCNDSRFPNIYAAHNSNLRSVFVTDKVFQGVAGSLYSIRVAGLTSLLFKIGQK